MAGRPWSYHQTVRQNAPFGVPIPGASIETGGINKRFTLTTDADGKALFNLSMHTSGGLCLITCPGYKDDVFVDSQNLLGDLGIDSPQQDHLFSGAGTRIPRLDPGIFGYTSVSIAIVGGIGPVTPGSPIWEAAYPFFGASGGAVRVKFTDSLGNIYGPYDIDPSSSFLGPRITPVTLPYDLLRYEATPIDSIHWGPTTFPPQTWMGLIYVASSTATTAFFIARPELGDGGGGGDCPPGSVWDPIRRICMKDYTGSLYNTLGVGNRYRAVKPQTEINFQRSYNTTPPIREVVAAEIDGNLYREFRFIWREQLYEAVATRYTGGNGSEVWLLASEDDGESWHVLSSAEGTPMPLFPTGYRHPDIVEISHGTLFASYKPDSADENNIAGLIKMRFRAKGEEFPGDEFTPRLYDRSLGSYTDLRASNNTFKLCPSESFENSISLILQLEDGTTQHLTSEDDGETWEIIPSEA